MHNLRSTYDLARLGQSLGRFQAEHRGDDRI